MVDGNAMLIAWPQPLASTAAAKSGSAPAPPRHGAAPHDHNPETFVGDLISHFSTTNHFTAPWRRSRQRDIKEWSSLTTYYSHITPYLAKVVFLARKDPWSVSTYGTIRQGVGNRHLVASKLRAGTRMLSSLYLTCKWDTK